MTPESAANTDSPRYDIVVMGAGIHGASIACEAAERGLKTLLIQAGRVAGTASCVPSDIVGAGLNNLENFQIPTFVSNRDALRQLNQLAPQCVRPINAAVVRNTEVRSDRKVTLGLRLYRKLMGEKPEAIDAPGIDSDSVYPYPATHYLVNYKRILIALLQQLAKNHGDILYNHKVTQANREENSWRITATSEDGIAHDPLNTRVLINCTGCHSSHVIKDIAGASTRAATGSLASAQIYFESKLDWKDALVFQRENKSLVYAHKFDPQNMCLGPIIADDESDQAKHNAIEACLHMLEEFTGEKIRIDNLTHVSWSKHPLVEDPSASKLSSTNITYLDLNNPQGNTPLLSLIGNNLVQFKRVADQALDILEPFTGKKKTSSSIAPLPGGDFKNTSPSELTSQLLQRCPFIPEEAITRLVNTYGTNAMAILAHVSQAADLGTHFGNGLYQVEVDYLIENEWADCAEDVLWRRTYLGLRQHNTTPINLGELEDYIHSNTMAFA